MHFFSCSDGLSLQLITLILESHGADRVRMVVFLPSNLPEHDLREVKIIFF